MRSRAHYLHVLGRGDRRGVDAVAGRDDRADRECPEGLDDPAQQLLLTLKAGAERDQNEGVNANRRRPLLRPEWIVEPGTDMLYDRRQRRGEVERPARQDEHACGTPSLVEDVLEGARPCSARRH